MRYNDDPEDNAIRAALLANHDQRVQHGIDLIHGMDQIKALEIFALIGLDAPTPEQYARIRGWATVGFLHVVELATAPPTTGAGS